MPAQDSNFLKIAAALATTTNVTIPSDLSANAASVAVGLDLTGFTGTLDFEGSLDGSNWVSLPYLTLASAVLTPATAQLSYTTSTTTPVYIIPLSMPFMRLKMARSAGTFTAWVRNYTEPFAMAIGPVQPAPPSPAPAAASSVYSPISSIVTAAVLKGAAGNVFKIFATNDNATVRYLQLHNKATIPLATEVPQRSWKIPAGTANNPGYVELEFKYADAFTTGIGFAISTTQATFTDSATASEHTKTVEFS